jgi:hypothetical protein
MVKYKIITTKSSLAMVFDKKGLEDNKYVEYNDESTTMASLYAVIDVLENIPEDSEDLHIILLPKCLELMLKLDQPAKIRDNGYKTEKGASLTEEFVDLMCYANELRAYLTTGVVRIKIQGSQLLYKNEIEMINTAWKITDSITITKTEKETEKKIEITNNKGDDVMSNELRNFILIEENDIYLSCTFANASSTPEFKKHTAESTSRYENYLKIINNHLLEILKHKVNGTSLSMYYLLIPDDLCEEIKEKNFVNYYSENNSDDLDKPNQWLVFSNLYKILFRDIIFKPNNYYDSGVTYEYKHIIFTKEILSKMHNYIDYVYVENNLVK